MAIAILQALHGLHGSPRHIRQGLQTFPRNKTKGRPIYTWRTLARCAKSP